MIRCCAAAVLMIWAGVAVALHVTEGRIPVPPPGASVAAGYLTLGNPMSESVHVLRAESPRFKRVEMHRTVLRDGIAHMEPVARLAVPATGQIRFAPGGLHLMLIKPVRPLQMGERVPVYLILDNGDRLKVDLTVIEPGAHANQKH